MAKAFDPIQLAKDYHRLLPERTRRYLNGRGISDEVINLHLLGWTGQRITIPIFDRGGKLAFFKLAKDPDDASPGPKMLTPSGMRTELYGWERLCVKPPRIVICEGEFDRLVLESQGIAAVTSTGGAGVFRAEWAEAFREIPEVFVCFDRDEAGKTGAVRVGRLIPHAKLVDLPDEVGQGGDVTDFFVRLGKTREDFLALLEKARLVPPSPMKSESGSGRLPVGDARPNVTAQALKTKVPIADVVGQYVELRPSGENLKALCPLHEDHLPSLVVYPATGTFRCFGCGRGGDVIAFIREVEKLSFSEALEVMKRLAHSDGAKSQ